MFRLSHGKDPAELTCRLQTRATAPQLNSTWPASEIKHAPVVVVTVQLFPSAYGPQKRQICPPVCTQALDLTFASDASASAGQTSTAPCPVSASYQPPDDSPSVQTLAFHSCFCSMEVGGHLTEEASEQGKVNLLLKCVCFPGHSCFPPELLV